MNSLNITWHQNKITSQNRELLNGHAAACLWFTGLSGSGKSTLSVEVENLLFQNGIRTYVLDGDNIRHGLNKDLTFSDADRKENIRRIGEVAKLFVDAGIIVLTAFISPFRADRDFVRSLIPEGKFIEIFVDCDLATCEKRDPKGLYKKARENKIVDFTGLSSPYEEPEDPEMVIFNGENSDINKNAARVIEFLLQKNIIQKT